MKFLDKIPLTQKRWIPGQWHKSPLEFRTMMNSCSLYSNNNVGSWFYTLVCMGWGIKTVESMICINCAIGLISHMFLVHFTSLQLADWQWWNITSSALYEINGFCTVWNTSSSMETGFDHSIVDVDTTKFVGSLHWMIDWRMTSNNWIWCMIAWPFKIKF